MMPLGAFFEGIVAYTCVVDSFASANADGLKNQTEVAQVPIPSIGALTHRDFVEKESIVEESLDSTVAPSMTIGHQRCLDFKLVFGHCFTAIACS